MTDFNSINNFNFIKIHTNSTQNKGTVEISDKNLSVNIEQNKNLPLNRPLEQVNPALIYNLQLAKMDNETLIKYLQSLLALPNSIDDFIKKANSNTKNSEILKIIVENLIDTKALAEFLNEKSKIAIDKTLQTISTALKSGIEDNSQLKEILSILTFIQAQSSSNSNILKEFLLLYIPINGQIFDKQVEYNITNNEEKEKIKTQDLSIMFETINFSNILCTLNAENNDVLVYFYVPDYFPKNKIKKILEDFSKSTNINSLVEFKIKNINLNKKDDTQNFKVVSKNYISPKILILSHLIIKMIFKIDSEFSI